MRKAWLYSKVGIAPSKLLTLEEALTRLGFEIAAHPQYPSPSPLRRMDGVQAARWADFAIAIGGDGTFLRAFHEVDGRIPILGVNSGDSVGFLLECTLDRFEEAMRSIAEQAFRIEDRLAGLVSTRGWSSTFANEVVVASAHYGALIRAAVMLDDELIMDGRADGLIVSTPTGSTAYALSAGGPVVDPSLSAFALVPLAPFTATLKPYIAPADKRLTIAVEGNCRAIVDGILAQEFRNCEFSIARAPVSLKMIRLPHGESLKAKLTRRLLDTPPHRSPEL